MSAPAGPAVPRPSAPTPYTTDPGVDAVESLYRGTPGQSGLRAYRPSLRPPEETSDYGWLFRPDTAPASGSSPAEPAATTTTGVAVRPAPGWSPAVQWSGPAVAPARRWPAALLVGAALVGVAVVSWFATGTPAP